MELDKEALIKKWLNGDLTEAENQAFSELEDAELNIAIAQNAKAFKASEVDDFETFKKYYETKTNKSQNWLGSLLRVASILVVGVMLYFVLFSNSDTTFETEIAEKTSFDLPDASSVTINAMSTVSFNKNDWQDNRELELKGEAYFKVAEGKTFNVITEQGTVTVVGTEFNVKQRDNLFAVQCFEGTVSVSFDNTKEILQAGNTFRKINGQPELGSTKSSQPDWTANKSNFTKEPFGEVVNELMRQYDIQVDLNGVDANRLFSGGFPHNNIENALIAITKPMNLTYKMSASNQVVIHGANQ